MLSAITLTGHEMRSDIEVRRRVLTSDNYSTDV